MIIGASANSPAAQVTPTKPASARACHAAAVLCFLGGAAGVCAALVGALPFGYFYTGLATAGSALLWWALGDILAALHHIAHK